MAMMLRAVGIPSRLVSGFKGAELNTRTGRLEIRQLHAHAWVEAYIDSVWTTMDPTPQAREEQVAVLSEQSQRSWSRWGESWRQTWNRGLRLSKVEQESLIYAPLQNGFQQTMDSLKDVRGTAARMREWIAGLAASPDRWISWRGGVAAFFLLTCLFALIRLTQRLWQIVREATGAANAGGGHAVIIPFYERYRKLLADHGLQRGISQTQREFALDARGTFSSALAASELDDLPRQLAERFYAVRFGSEPLSNEELEDLNHKLDLLDRCLNGRATAAAGKPVDA
jgi:hypothetical protein